MCPLVKARDGAVRSGLVQARLGKGERSFSKGVKKFAESSGSSSPPSSAQAPPLLVRGSGDAASGPGDASTAATSYLTEKLPPELGLGLSPVCPVPPEPILAEGRHCWTKRGPVSHALVCGCPAPAAAVLVWWWWSGSAHVGDAGAACPGSAFPNLPGQGDPTLDP